MGRPKAGPLAVDAEAAIGMAALELFSKSSYASVSTKEIAAAAGLNTALIYYYFGNKEALFQRTILLAVQHARQRFRLVGENTSPAADVVFRWIDCHAAEFKTVSRLMKISMGYVSTSDRNPTVDEAISGFHQETREILRAAISRGVTQNEFFELDVNQTVTFMATYLDGVYMRAIIFPKFNPKPEIEELRAFVRARLSASSG